MIKLTYYAEWHGERAAGINPGSEEIEITLKHSQSIGEDDVEFWCESLAQYFDGAFVKFTGWERR